MAEESHISIAFGIAIKQERLKKGVTQEELADRCGLDRTYISHIERGLKNPTLSVVWDIAISLEISLLSLIGVTMQNLPTGPHKASNKSSRDSSKEQSE